MCYDAEVMRGNGMIAEEDGRQIRKEGGSGREVKERESGQRLGNNRPRRKIHENLFLISWPIAVYIYVQWKSPCNPVGDFRRSRRFPGFPCIAAKNCTGVSEI